jgi:hypothetical protein
MPSPHNPGSHNRANLEENDQLVVCPSYHPEPHLMIVTGSTAATGQEQVVRAFAVGGAKGCAVQVRLHIVSVPDEALLELEVGQDAFAEPVPVCGRIRSLNSITLTNSWSSALCEFVPPGIPSRFGPNLLASSRRAPTRRPLITRLARYVLGLTCRAQACERP